MGKWTDQPISRREAVGRVARVGAGAYMLGAMPLFARWGPAIAQERPNILFLFSDDHAVQAISAYGWGNSVNQTPNIDRIANEGAIFLNSFCTNSLCAPSRAAILTGKFGHVNGKMDNRMNHPFDTSQPMFNKVLQRAGYQTAMIGKWHLINNPEGFDFWRVLPGQGNYYNPEFITPQGQTQIEGYVTDIITDLALEWLEDGRDQAQPFLLMCQHKAPHRNWMPGPDHLMTYEDVVIPEPPSLFDDYSHRASPAHNTTMTIRDDLVPEVDLKITPHNPDDPTDRGGLTPIYNRMTDAQKAAWDAAYEPRNARFREANPQGDDLVHWYYQRYMKDYLRCVAGVDDNVGRVLEYLDSSGLADNTLVVYSSDQGFYLGEHGWFDKRWMYEESFRMPFVARWPGHIEPGTRVPQMIQNIDYAPTFISMAGVDVPEDIQGESFVGLMTGDAPREWRHSLYYHYYEYPDWHHVAPHYGVRTERYKLVYYYDTNEWELFDLVEDPHEMNSLYDDLGHAELVTQLKAELHRLRRYYRDTTGPEFE
jgi:arylsulfatase A-like enzyme